MEDLILEGSEEAALTALENEIQAQFKSIREHMRDTDPIGATKGNMAEEEPEEDEDAEDEDEEVMDDDSEDMSS